MKSKVFLLFIGIIAASAATNVVIDHFELPAAKVTVRVVGENGQPIENANVSLGFGYTSVQGTTDPAGCFTGEGHCGIAGVGSTIKKEGYYLSVPPIPRFTECDKAFNQWRPWNGTYTAILRQVGKPVALYAECVEVPIPTLDKPCGFDLEAGDWVAPYGKGERADFIFTLHQEIRGVQDYDVSGELTFNALPDGIQEAPMSEVGTNSVFPWDRLAPSGGYQAKLHLQNSWRKDKGIIRSFKFADGIWEGYFFRARAVEQAGQIVSACYGKIRGGIEVFPNEPAPKVAFTYYFNRTTNDRNLEWDTTRNLFGNSSFLQAPRDP